MLRYRLLFSPFLLVCALAFLAICLSVFAVSAETSTSEQTGGGTVTLPLNQTSYKIEVAENGIYELTYDDLLAVGMTVSTVNPRKFELMHQGESVRYTFVGDNDTKFEQGEKIRFYGAAFDGSDYERQYVTSNYYWLWADGTRRLMSTADNSTGKPVATQWRAVETTQPELIFNPGYFRWSANHQNEPDAWYWEYIKSGTPLNLSLPVSHPASGAGVDDAMLTAEFLTTFRSSNLHTISVQLGAANLFSTTLFAPRSGNVVGTISPSDLSDGDNNVLVTVDTASTNDYALLDRITLEYWREFVADDNQLIFSTTEAASHAFLITGLSGASAENLLVWDITNPIAVANIQLTSDDVTANSVRFERNLASGDRSFIVTSVDNIKQPHSITAYNAQNLTPAEGAEWLAISHADFMTETQRLADYRQNVRHMNTHVVDVEDVVNQYGYGYNTPESIKTYIQTAYDTWSERPEYLLLVGDATQNPLQRECESPICFSTWDTSVKTYVPTDLVHEDRFLGLTPSDHSYSLLEGDDLLPDIAVGRIAARDADAVATVVNKTIRYEEAVFADEAWTRKMAWLADDADRGGDFCAANKLVRDNYTPSDFDHFVRCLGDYFADDSSNETPAPVEVKDQVRGEFFNYMNATSAGFVNYRGHGSISGWASNMINRSHADQWQNSDKPTIILSADCLDSHFSWVEQPQSLSETFMQIDNGGSVAHWGSTGLGFTSEHTALHTSFYGAIYGGTARRVGDATVASKIAYIGTGNDISEAFAFTLHGDPALHINAPAYNEFKLDALLTAGRAPIDSTRIYEAKIHNTGTVADTFTLTVTMGDWQAEVDTMLVTVPANSTAAVTLNHFVPDNVAIDDIDSFVLEATSAELQTTQSLTFTTTVSQHLAILPLITK